MRDPAPGREALERRIAELETRLSELTAARASDPYRALFERSADAILIIRGETFIDCNDATVHMLRYRDKAELLQTHPSELSPEFQPDGRPSFEKANEMIAIAFREGSHRFEWDHVRADGEVFPVEVLLTAVPEGDDHVLHVVWRDITDRKRLEAELRHAQKMEAMGRLAGGVAHDFNNLLVAILGYAELLQAELADQPELRQEVVEIQRAAERAATLTSQLLAFSRKQVLRPEVMDLEDVIRGLEGILRRLIGADIRLVTQLSGQSATVKVDPGQLEQLVLNLASNARDAMPRGGTLTLKAGRSQIEERPHARLEVSDTGVGMSRATLARAFDPFFTTKERGRGTGLGLASVYGIVKQSGGDIGVTSVEGSGTSFVIQLPLTDERVAAGHDAPRPGPTRAGDATVVVAEDEPAVAGLIRRVLVRHGYRVLEARNGAEALALTCDHDGEFALLLTDVVMPVMSGPALARRLRERGSTMPVLFMSGYTDDALSEQGFDVAEVDILRKPFSPSELLERVATALSQVV